MQAASLFTLSAAAPCRRRSASYDDSLQQAEHPAQADDIDTILMTRAAGGDFAAFEELVRRNQSGAWALAWHCLGDTSEAQDIVQEAFLKIYKAASRYRPTAKFKTYLYRVVTRLCLDWQAKKRPDYADSLPSVADLCPGPEALAGQVEVTGAVRKCLAGLPTNQRIAITLRHYDGMNYGEIAEVLSVSTKAVDSLLQRARDSLRKRLLALK